MTGFMPLTASMSPLGAPAAFAPGAFGQAFPAVNSADAQAAMGIPPQEMQMAPSGVFGGGAENFTPSWELQLSMFMGKPAAMTAAQGSMGTCERMLQQVQEMRSRFQSLFLLGFMLELLEMLLVLFANQGDDKNPQAGSAGAANPGIGGGSDAGVPQAQAGSVNADGSVSTVMRQGKPIGASIAPAFDAMVAAARQDGVELKITSGYRSHAQQTALWNANPTPGMVARPGTSMHEKGQAIDFANTPGAYAWLKRNASRFGLHNYPREAWHYSTNGH